MNRFPFEKILVYSFGFGLLVSLIAALWREQSPQVVVLSPDAAPPALLKVEASEVIAGDRAALWWAVYCKTLEKHDSTAARGAARAAVETVYGEK